MGEAEEMHSFQTGRFSNGCRTDARLDAVSDSPAPEGDLPVLQRYTRQLFAPALFYAKFRWFNYLALRSITLSFCLFSMIYSDARKLKIRRGQPRGGSTPPPGTRYQALFSIDLQTLFSFVA
jgi:hypothetical protein